MSMASQAAALKGRECIRQMSIGACNGNDSALDSRYWHTPTSTKNIPVERRALQTKFKTYENAEISIWSPFDDDIVAISSRSRVNKEIMKKRVDDYINSVLYGKGKSPLPIFEHMCRELIHYN